MDWEVSWKRKSELAELEDNGRHSKRSWNASSITFPSSDNCSLSEYKLSDGKERIQDLVLTDYASVENIDTSPTSIPLQDTEIICYGALCDVKARLSPALLSGLSVSAWDQFCELGVYKKGSYYNIRQNKDGDDVGIIDLVTTNVLKSLEGWPKITLSIVIALQALTPARKKVSSAVVVDASVNVLGPKNLLDAVGDAIMNRQSHLQHPYFLPVGTEYFNPHFFYRRGIRVNLRHLIGPQETPEVVRLAQGLGDIFNSLAKPEHSNHIFSSSIEAIYENGLITTTLKRHQEEAISFILAREDRGIAASSTQMIRGVIGHEAFKSHPSLMLGGILADAMGLGKTLTMLSAIVCTMGVATEFSRPEPGNIPLPPTRATLVVASSPQVMEVWKADIKSLIDNDIILTTYQTLVSDRKAKGLLQSLMWFRVVLDEAHWIRNNSSQQFKAACGLTAHRRWCLSGTPIQNSLDDLRSLLEFLHFLPFSEPRFFRQYIVEPLRDDSPNGFRNLRLLMRLICFRRTSALLSLPQPSTKAVTINLTEEEQQLYEDILSASKKEYEEIIDMRSTKKKYCVLFTATMKLRRLCNHGTFQHGSTAQGLLTPMSHAKRWDEKKINTQGDLPCEYCDGDNADIGTSETALEACPECSRVLDNRVEKASSSGSISPVPSATSDHGSISSGLTLSERAPPITNVRLPQRVEPGFSSKLNAVVDNIEASPESSKHLVFTSWRLTLDILQRLLTRRGIPCLRIDGKTSFPDRKSTLVLFHQDPTIKVLLLSIATGAVGLTLTVANYVHLVEPQWNPLVEEQAIGRALRIGQERPVTIYKYVTKSTVERNIMTLQERKNQLVKISLDECAGDRVQQGLEDLMFVIQRDAM